MTQLSYHHRHPEALDSWNELARQNAIMRDALKAARQCYWVHNAAVTSDIEALRRVALSHAEWVNNVLLPTLRSVEGGAE